MQITGFGHVWEPVLPDVPDVTSSLPAPYDAYGVSKWMRISCAAPHAGSCASYTIAAATKLADRIPAHLGKLNVLLGVSRNKRLAKVFRESKRIVEEIEEVVESVHSESSSESSSSDEGDGESVVSEVSSE